MYKRFVVLVHVPSGGSGGLVVLLVVLVGGGGLLGIAPVVEPLPSICSTIPLGEEGQTKVAV